MTNRDTSQRRFSVQRHRAAAEPIPTISVAALVTTQLVESTLVRLCRLALSQLPERRNPPELSTAAGHIGRILSQSKFLAPGLPVAVSGQTCGRRVANWFGLAKPWHRPLPIIRVLNTPEAEDLRRG
uniref:DUF4158 domain-containing protein n=1 Tax=Macrostomum lignano TaxID=282301 RepID=A0A1I8FT39_9PLAT